MSTENLIAFGEKINRSHELLAEVQDMGSDLEALVGLGAREGFDFTAQELKSYLVAYVKNSGKLSDAELEQVAGAGGGWPPPDTHPILCDGGFHG
jgi:predicted ribosomally synthesized peptide with nif11-like leader